MRYGRVVPEGVASVDSMRIRTVTLLIVMLFGLAPLFGAAAPQHQSTMCSPMRSPSPPTPTCP